MRAGVGSRRRRSHFPVPFLARVPKVFVLHGSEWFVIPDAFPWYDRLYTRAIVPWYCRRATRVIAVSRRVRADALAFTGVGAEKIVAVHNGFDATRFGLVRDPRALADVRARYAIREPFVLWAGQLYPPKNVGRLVTAFASVAPKVRHVLVIAGEPRGRRATADLSRIAELGLESRVRFTGWISHDDLAALYTMADLFVFPSLYEGFGIPLLESMACGCPVVTSNTGSPPEVVDGAALLVDPHEVREIADAMLRVLGDPALRQTLSTRGPHRARAFSWDRCGANVLAALEHAASHGAAPAAADVDEDHDRRAVAA